MMPNPSKSEAVVAGTAAQLAKFPNPLIINVAGADVQCSNSIVSLGVHIDSSLTCDRRVSSIVSACSYHLRALRHIRPALSEETAVIVGRAIILSRIDYCNSLLINTSEDNINRLQRLQNRLIRAIKKLPYRADVTAARESLHWLPVRERITYKVAMLTFKALSCHQPPYLSELLTYHIPPRSTRSSSDLSRLTVPRTRNKRASCNLFISCCCTYCVQ
jgi:hypothetical protein